MNNENYFKEVFESIPNYKKIVVFFLFPNDIKILNECGFLGSDINRLILEFKDILSEQIDE